MHPEIGAEHIILGFNRGLYTIKEKQSHPDDLAKSYLDTLSINIRKRGSIPHILPGSALIIGAGKIPEMRWLSIIYALISKTILQEEQLFHIILKYPLQPGPSLDQEVEYHHEETHHH